MRWFVCLFCDGCVDSSADWSLRCSFEVDIIQGCGQGFYRVWARLDRKSQIGIGFPLY